MSVRAIMYVNTRTGQKLRPRGAPPLTAVHVMISTDVAVSAGLVNPTTVPIHYTTN